MSELDKKYLFRMTHIENIPHILEYGITHVSSPNSNPDFVPIGDSTLISTRNDFVLNNGRRLGEYIPFYFGTRTPMLYVVQNGYNMVTTTPAQNIVYCITSVQMIIDLKLDFVFTDGHAVDCFSTQYLPDDVSELEDIIDWTAVKAKYWKDDNDLDLKRRKEAEFLVLGDIPLNGIVAYIVYNQNAKDSLVNFGVNDKIVYVMNNHYF